MASAFLIAGICDQPISIFPPDSGGHITIRYPTLPLGKQKSVYIIQSKLWLKMNAQRFNR